MPFGLNTVHSDVFLNTGTTFRLTGNAVCHVQTNSMNTMRTFFALLFSLNCFFALNAQVEEVVQPCGSLLPRVTVSPEQPLPDGPTPHNPDFEDPPEPETIDGFDCDITIPVVVHLLNCSEELFYKDEWVQAEVIDRLNRDFGGQNPDNGQVPQPFQSLIANTGIKFCLATRDPYGQVTTGITRRVRTAEREDFGNCEIYSSLDMEGACGYNAYFEEAKFTSLGGTEAWDTKKYLNIWIVPKQFYYNPANCDYAYLCGYSSLPTATTPSTDGVVIAGFCVQSGNLAHEVGHYLGLKHIWGDEPACNMDDGVQDTPLQADLHFSECPTFPFISCNNGPNGDMFVNFMDYSSCKYMFTPGQGNRMCRYLNSKSSIRYTLGHNNDLACCPNPDKVPSNFTVTALGGGGLLYLSWEPQPLQCSQRKYEILYREAGCLPLNWSVFAVTSNPFYLTSTFPRGRKLEFKVHELPGGPFTAEHVYFTPPDPALDDFIEPNNVPADATSLYPDPDLKFQSYTDSGDPDYFSFENDYGIELSLLSTESTMGFYVYPAAYPNMKTYATMNVYMSTPITNYEWNLIPDGLPGIHYLKVTGNGRYLIRKEECFGGPVAGGGKQGAPPAISDAFSGIRTEGDLSDAVAIPNPAGDYVNLITSASGEKKVFLTSVTGQLIWESEFPGNELKIDLSAQPNGVYFMRVQKEGFARVLKVLVRK